MTLKRALVPSQTKTACLRGHRWLSEREGPRSDGGVSLSCHSVSYLWWGVCVVGAPSSTSRMTRAELRGVSMETCVVVAFPPSPLGRACRPLLY